MTTQASQDINPDDIQRAFDEGLFTVVYQAQVALSAARPIVGAEAFVRLDHPDYGLMVPSTFLPLVIESGKMLALTKSVLEQVAHDWKQWNKSGFDLNVSVNIDGSVLLGSNLGRELGKIISDHKIPKHKLTLEFANIFENGRVNDDIGKKLLGLRMKGYDLSLDDFGLDLMTQNAFKDLPLDEIKIDRQVIQTLLVQEKSQAIVRNAMRQANSYGMRVVAVGVEVTEESEWLARNGCDRGQGYLFGKPVSGELFMQQFLDSGQTSVIQPKRTSILILEDDPQYQALLVESLSDKYDTQVAGTIQEADALIENLSPAIIIADVHLPDGSGIDFCKSEVGAQAKLSASTIFISGGRDFENKLEAYEAGGIDFIEKPFSIIELIAKIKQVDNYQSRRRELISDVGEAQSLVMQSLKDAAYYGDIVQFFKNLMTCKDEAQMARELFRFMELKSLNSSIEFRGNKSYSNFDQVNGVCSPIELNVFELLRDKGRLYEFGKRILVNDKHISFLIKQLPDDEHEQGKIRDYIAVLIEGMEARYKDILRQRVLNSVMQQLQGLAQQLISIVEKGQVHKIETLEKYSFELQMSFHTLDLTDDQEQHITAIINKMLSTKDQEEKSTSDISEQVNQILETMKQSLDGFDADDASLPTEEFNDAVELF